MIMRQSIFSPIFLVNDLINQGIRLKKLKLTRETNISNKSGAILQVAIGVLQPSGLKRESCGRVRTIGEHVAAATWEDVESLKQKIPGWGQAASQLGWHISPWWETDDFGRAQIAGILRV